MRRFHITASVACALSVAAGAYAESNSPLTNASVTYAPKKTFTQSFDKLDWNLYLGAAFSDGDAAFLIGAGGEKAYNTEWSLGAYVEGMFFDDAFVNLGLFGAYKADPNVNFVFGPGVSFGDDTDIYLRLGLQFNNLGPQNLRPFVNYDFRDGNNVLSLGVSFRR